MDIVDVEYEGVLTGLDMLLCGFASDGKKYKHKGAKVE